jgi:molecular chaperone GrpE (heat shock protein)
VSSLLKLEKKTKTVLDEYRSSIDKYNNVRAEYERKLADSANHLQYAEETHLKQMRVFVDAYSRALAASNAQRQHVYAEFNARLGEQFTNEYLVHLFIEAKRTGGPERPEPAVFIEFIDYVNR